MSDWLAAYEAQKAKALKKIEERKSGASAAGGNDQWGAMAGSTSVADLVDAKDVRHLSRSTQITKIMDGLKKKEAPVKPKPAPPPPKPAPAPVKSPAASAPTSFTELPSQNASSGLECINKSYGEYQSSDQPPHAAGLPAYPKPTEGISSNPKPLMSVSSGPKPLMSTGHPSSSNTTSGHGNGGLASTGFPAPSSGGVGVSVNHPESNKKAKKRAQHNEPAVSDLLRKVKRDASRSAGDWKSLYEERKKQALENMSKAKDEDVNVSAISAYGSAPPIEVRKSPPRSQKPAQPKQSGPAPLRSGPPTYPKPPGQTASTAGLPSYPKPLTNVGTPGRTQPGFGQDGGSGGAGNYPNRDSHRSGFGVNGGGGNYPNRDSHGSGFGGNGSAGSYPNRDTHRSGFGGNGGGGNYPNRDSHGSGFSVNSGAGNYPNRDTQRSGFGSSSGPGRSSNQPYPIPPGQPTSKGGLPSYPKPLMSLGTADRTQTDFGQSRGFGGNSSTGNYQNRDSNRSGFGGNGGGGNYPNHDSRNRGGVNDPNRDSNSSGFGGNRGGGNYPNRDSHRSGFSGNGGGGNYPNRDSHRSGFGSSSGTGRSGGGGPPLPPHLLNQNGSRR